MGTQEQLNLLGGTDDVPPQPVAQPMKSPASLRKSSTVKQVVKGAERVRLCRLAENRPNPPPETSDRLEEPKWGRCRQCDAPIRIPGLDHSLCSASCGWVVDLEWQAQQLATEAKKHDNKNGNGVEADHDQFNFGE